MKKSIFPCIAFSLTITAFAFAEEALTPAASIHGEWTALGAVHRTGGSGDKTLIRRGDFFTNELSLTYDQPLWDEWVWHTDMRLRKTADPQIDKRKDFHLLGFRTELSNRTLTITGGDIYADYSQYTAQQSVRGAEVTFANERADIRGLLGRLYEEDESFLFARYTGALKSDFLIIQDSGIFKDFWLGYNFSQTEDDRDSIENKTAVLDASNRVGSLNSRFLLLNNTAVDTEIARSWVDRDTSPGSNIDRQIGTALRANAYTRWDDKTKTRFNYEWVGADFNSLAGSASPDRVNFSGKLDRKINSLLKAEALYKIYYDKLDHSLLDRRTITQSPRLSLQWTPISEDWYFKDLYSRLYVEQRNRHSQEVGDNSTGQTDFQANEIGIENEFSIHEVRYNTGYSVRKEDDDRIRTNDSLIHSIDFGFLFTHHFGNIEATPHLFYKMDYEQRDKEGGRDLTQTLTAELFTRMDDALSFNQRYSVETGSYLAEESDSTRFNAYFALDYKIPGKLDRTLTISYERNDYAHPESTSKFSENNLEIRHLLRF